MVIRTSLRQGQFITPFGVGSLHVNSEGVSLITAGLDFWPVPNSTDDGFRLDEFKIQEVRLQKLLNVDFFCLPPDYRRREHKDSENINKEISIPVYRFPLTYFCQYCHLIQSSNQIASEKMKCSKCNSYAVVPFPLISVCDHGHAQEFPFREWVHRSSNPKCEGRIFFKDSGNPGLKGLGLSCEECNAFRDLDGVTSSETNNNDQTVLTEKLDKNNRFLCSGHKPWLYNPDPDPCTRSLRGSLRSAGNLYFPIIKSAIHIPIEGISKKLHKVFENNLKLMGVIDFLDNPSASDLKTKFPELIDFSTSEIESAIKLYKGTSELAPDIPLSIKSLAEIQHELKLEEYKSISRTFNSDTLKVKSIPIDSYDTFIQENFEKICLVEKLRETRALTGFTRINSEAEELKLEDLQNLMRQNPVKEGERWLPANVVFGEGIFLQIRAEKLKAWETKNHIRANRLSRNYSKARNARGLLPAVVEPRFILIHTLAHIIMNKLTFEAGYSTASLRERLYVSSKAGEEMHGLLIYTAAGDSDGTMGGLVRLGEPGQLDTVIKKSIDEAFWCSTDPVCMEMGSQGGQGPDNCNLSACHNCSLVPETACEEFNRFLDRGSLVRDLNESEIGFFSFKSN